MQTIDWAEGLRGVTGNPWPGVRYFCTWRAGGVSAAPWDSLNLGLHVGDDAAAVLANRARVRAALPAEPVWLDQVHGTDVFEAMMRSPGTVVPPRDTPGAAPAVLQAAPCADAAITRLPGQPLAIMTADCLPVVLADQAGTVLGVAHAGWRGLVAGVLENTLLALRRQAPQAQGWRAWVGPGIGADAFEVGDEVRVAFTDRDPSTAPCFTPSCRRGHWRADLAALAAGRLAQAGVAQVELSGECTYRQADRYFSYRRENQTGRQVTLAWLL